MRNPGFNDEKQAEIINALFDAAMEDARAKEEAERKRLEDEEHDRHVEHVWKLGEVMR